MIDMFDHMILTYGVKWSKIFDKHYNIIEIHWINNPNFIDATGAWDAYRAWLLKGLSDWYDWEASARIGAVLASLSVWEFWGQNHFIDWEQFNSLYEQTFWEQL
jgi:sugar/nucleoside kinase (ribokinase family)